MMKIVCDTAVLCEAVANVSRAVSAKSALPVLSGILFRTDGLKAVTLSGYDLEMGITTTIPAEVEEEGELVLSAKLLFEMLRKLPAERVTLACDDKLLTVIRGGTAEFAILAMDADEFPDMPAPRQEDSIHLPQPVLKSMINQTIFAVASGDTKPVHTGSKFEAEGDLLTIVSVDGFRLAMRKEHAQLSGPMSFVVPGKTLSEIAKLLGDEEEESCDIAVGRRHVVFSIGGYSVVSRLLDGEFPQLSFGHPRKRYHHRHRRGARAHRDGRPRLAAHHRSPAQSAALPFRRQSHPYLLLHRHRQGL